MCRHRLVSFYCKFPTYPHFNKRKEAKENYNSNNSFIINNQSTNLKGGPSKYSPHLNKIETLWHKTKYEWIRPEDYSSYKTLKQAVLNIFSLVGRKYKINFKS